MRGDPLEPVQRPASDPRRPVSEEHLSEAVLASYRVAADRYENRWARYLEQSIGATLAALDPQPGQRILDVGCGTGLLLRTAAGREPRLELWGVDRSPEMLEVAKSAGTGGAAVVLADAARLGFRAECFDAVLSSSSLHHWARPEEVLAEIHRVSRPGARVVITDWCRDVLLFLPLALYLRATDSSVQTIFSLAGLQRLLREAGFRIERTRVYRIPPLWGMMTVTGVRQR